MCAWQRLRKGVGIYVGLSWHRLPWRGNRYANTRCLRSQVSDSHAEGRVYYCRPKIEGSTHCELCRFDRYISNQQWLLINFPTTITSTSC